MTPALAAVGPLPVARMERVPLPVRAALVDPQHDGGCGDSPVLQQRRGALELHDGHGNHLFVAADCDLLCASPLHGSGPDEGCRQGLRVGRSTRSPTGEPARRALVNRAGGPDAGARILVTQNIRHFRSGEGVRIVRRERSLRKSAAGWDRSERRRDRCWRPQVDSWVGAFGWL